MSEQISAGPQMRPMYQASHDEDHGMDPGLMRALLIAAGIGAVAIIGYGVFKFAGHSGGAVPVVQADSRPMKVKPDNPGGMLVAPEQQAALPGQSQLAPGTEEPNPRALVSRQEPRREAGAVPPPHAKTFVVQLMATKTEAAAQTVWDQLTAKMPALLSGHHPLFLKTNEPGPTPWRLRTGGFTDQAQAKTFCDHLKGKGLTCVVSES